MILHDPDKVESVLVNETDRFARLHNGDVDLLLRGDVYLLGREVYEVSSAQEISLANVSDSHGDDFFS